MIRYLCIKLCCGSLTKAPNEKCLTHFRLVLFIAVLVWMFLWRGHLQPRLFYLHVWKSLGGVGINIIQQPRIRGGNPPANQQIPKSPSLNRQTKPKPLNQPNIQIQTGFFTLGSVWCHWEVISCLWHRSPTHPLLFKGCWKREELESLMSDTWRTVGLHPAPA